MSQEISLVRSSTDENGQTITIEVPKASMIERVAVFFMDPEGFDQPAPWQAYGLSVLIGEGLSANRFVDVYTLYSNYSEGNIWKLKRAGHASGLNAPLSLLADVATGYHQDYFVTGSLSSLEGGRWQADLKLYQVKSMDVMLDVTLQADSLFDLTDAATAAIGEKLQQPSDTTEITTRLPAQELVTENLEALRLYVEGKNVLMLDTDVEGAVERWNQAVTLDPGFSQVYRDLAAVHDSQGNNTEALAALKELNRLSHELNEEDKISIKAWTYQLQNENDRATRVYEMWTELYQDNHQAWVSLGYSYINNGNRIDKAIESFEKSLALMPNQSWLINELARLFRVKGDYDQAIARYEEYYTLLPQNYLPLISIGDIKTDQGDLKAAEKYYQRGQLAQTNMVTPIIRLAINQIQQGNVAEGISLFDEAEFVAEAPRQLSALAAARSQVHALLGQPSEALELLKKQYQIDSQSLSQFDAVIDHMRSLALYYQAGQAEMARAFMAQVAANFKPPYDFIPSIGFLVSALAEGKLDEAEFHNQKLAVGLSQSGRTDLLYAVDYTMGVLLRLRGDLPGAMAKLRQAATLFESSSQFTFDESRLEYDQIIIELGQTLVLAKQPDQAIEALQPLLTRWPYHPEANWIAAQAYQLQGNGPQAQQALEIAQQMWANAEAGFKPAQSALRGFEQAAVF